MNLQPAKDAVNAAIVESVMPLCYEAINDLISSIGASNIPKEDLVKYRRLLPGTYPNSFEYKKGKP